ncbi:unnamed protein product [Rotaria sordida]|uniref:Transmembrane protein n=1 Tax=Rotaria sordida TaxID=392033 RepID=A0A814KH82_9BILA|nr:unnamed protein product [Rotaria sordida]CAF1304696.1 unnamed protein product [Rotaria sordida]
MKLLFFIFLITQTQHYVFDRFIQNQTNIDENHLQELNKEYQKTSIRSMISNKVLIIIIIACLTIVITVALLTIYFNKNQIKNFARRMGLNKRATIIHQFHPEVLLHSSGHEQYKQRIPSYEQTHARLSTNIKSKSIYERKNRERISMHEFMNSSNKDQQDSISDSKYSKSAANLFLYH